MFSRREKKIKVVFKMQFQATQVPPMKEKGIMISLVPVDGGKPVVKSARAPIIEGTCIWEKPVYETVKLVQEMKTGSFREKFYYLILSTGSSKAGFMGEVSIDFADLAESTKPLKLTLPLQTSKSGAILLVTVQRIEGDTATRYTKGQESPITPSDQECVDTDVKDHQSYGRINSQSTESEDSSEATWNEQNENLGDAESDNSDGRSRDGTIKTPPDNFGKLTNQMKTLERKAEVSEMEVLSLRQQIIKEGKKGQKLTEQIDCLKQERDEFKAQCELLKSSANCWSGEEISRNANEIMSSLADTNQELEREKRLNKKLMLKLQETEDLNSEFVIALRDLNQRLDKKNMEISRLSSEIKAIRDSPNVVEEVPQEKIHLIEEKDMLEVNNLGDAAADEKGSLKQIVQNLISVLEVHKKEKTEIQMELKRLASDYKSIEMENNALHSKLMQNQKQSLETEQNYIQSFSQVKHLKLRAERLEEEVKCQELRYSKSLNVINELEILVDNQQRKLENQAQSFDENLATVTQAKIEYEQRAIRAEESFRKMRRNNANAAERLQEELKKLSAEMSSKIAETENLAQNSVAEANDLRQKNEHLQDKLHKIEEEHQIQSDEYIRILQQLQDQNNLMWRKEKEDLEGEVASVNRETEKLSQENSVMISRMEQMKTEEDNLRLELKMLRQRNNEMVNHLLIAELEKEKLKKEECKYQDGSHKGQGYERVATQNSVQSQLKEDLMKLDEQERAKTDIIQRNQTNQLEQCNAHAKDNDRMMVEGKNITVEDLHGTNKHAIEENKSVSTHQTMLQQKSDSSSDNWDIASLLSEISFLQEKNKTNEEGLKEMHERYSEISLRFAEVEGERQQLVMALRNLKNGKKN